MSSTARPGSGAGVRSLSEADASLPAQVTGAGTMLPNAANAGFDEAWYLAQNPGVAAAVRAGGFATGWDHFVQHGKAEGRVPGPAPVALAGKPDITLRPEADYLAPTELSVTETNYRRVLLIGSSLMSGWDFHRFNPFGGRVDFIDVDGGHSLLNPASELGAPEDYDFMVVQIPLRSIMPDAMLSSIAYSDRQGHEVAFKNVCARLAEEVREATDWNQRHGLLTFVANFFVPQRNSTGALLPRYDLRNPEFFIDRLNQHLEELVGSRSNVHVLDIDRLSASLGRRHVQDDNVELLSHNSVLAMPGPLTDRLEFVGPMTDYYDIRWPGRFPQAVYRELTSMIRAIQGTDAVNLVIVDLDSTLWSGIDGEAADVDGAMLEGWPIGFAEALLYLRKRGVLLALCSRHDESWVRGIWPLVFEGRIEPEDFVAIAINGRPKTDNVRDIMDGLGVAPSDVVFIDGNPLDRTVVQQEFPAIRLLGRHPYFLRRILLWSAETQTKTTHDNAPPSPGRKQLQLTRTVQDPDDHRGDVPAHVAQKLMVFEVSGSGDARSGSILDLLNTTNQFNTTGDRWSKDDFDRFLAARGRVIAYEMEDALSLYGLVGAVLVEAGLIRQWVMSCRVLGQAVEDAVMVIVIEAMRKWGAARITGRLVPTRVNFPCREVFSRCGFLPADDATWVFTGRKLHLPDHLTVVARS